MFKFSDRGNFNHAKSPERHRVITNMQTPPFTNTKLGVFIRSKTFIKISAEKKKKKKENNSAKLTAD